MNEFLHICDIGDKNCEFIKTEQTLNDETSFGSLQRIWREKINGYFKKQIEVGFCQSYPELQKIELSFGCSELTTFRSLADLKENKEPMNIVTCYGRF